MVVSSESRKKNREDGVEQDNEHLFDSAHLYKLLSSLIVQRNYFSFTLFSSSQLFIQKLRIAWLSLSISSFLKCFLSLPLYTFNQRSIIRLEPSIGIQEKFFAFPFSERVSNGERGTTMLYRRTCAIKMDTRERP